MTFTPSSIHDSRPQTAALVQENTNTSTFQTDSNNVRVGKSYSGTASPNPVSQSDIDARLKASQESQVTQALLLGKLDPTLIIGASGCNIATAKLANVQLVSNYNNISTLISNNPLLDSNGALTAQKYAWAEQIVLDAMAQGLCSAATILSTMSGGN